MTQTSNPPGPMSDTDKAKWQAFQDSRGLLVDGIVGHQTSGQVFLEMYERESKIEELKKHNANLLLVLGLAGLVALVVIASI